MANNRGLKNTRRSSPTATLKLNKVSSSKSSLKRNKRKSDQQEKFEETNIFDFDDRSILKNDFQNQLKVRKIYEAMQTPQEGDDEEYDDEEYDDDDEEYEEEDEEEDEDEDDDNFEKEDEEEDERENSEGRLSNKKNTQYMLKYGIDSLFLIKKGQQRSKIDYFYFPSYFIQKSNFNYHELKKRVIKKK